jgi:FHA domain
LGELVPAAARAWIAAGHTLVLGSTADRLRPAPPAAEARALPPGPGGWLVWCDQIGVNLTQVGAETIIGRSFSAAARIEDSAVERWHARVRRGRGRVRVVDDRSLNGVYVNGQRIDGAADLHDGDRLRVGRTELVYVEA